jgi:hypothetical protein
VAKNLNSEQLAYKAGHGVRGVQVRELEMGEKDVQVSTLIRIARALDIRSLDSLLGPMPIEELELDR